VTGSFIFSQLKQFLFHARSTTDVELSQTAERHRPMIELNVHAIREKIQFDSNRYIVRRLNLLFIVISAAIARADFPVAQMTRTPNPEDFISNADGISR